MAQGGHTFELIRGVNSIDLTDGVNYTLFEFDGLGMAPNHRLSQRGPFQDGETDVGYRLDPRTVLLSFAMHGEYTTLASNRAALLGFCKPGASTDPLKLRWTMPDGTQRQIDCHHGGDLSLPSNAWFQKHHRAVLSLRCPDPTLYDPTGTSVQFAQTGGSTGMAVPMAVPFTLGASTLDVTQAITLDGANAWDTYPIIYITGPVTSPVITNSATGEKLDFTGYSVGSGDTYTIDLRYGAKTVVDSSSANQTYKLTTDSNLATWRLVPGANSIRATGTSITGATSILIQFNQRYIGV